MISEVLSNIPMNINFESEWFPVNINYFKKELRAASLQLSWNNVSPNPDGIIEIYVSNNQSDAIFTASYPISSINNNADAELIILYPAYEYIRLKYKRNTIASGFLNAILCYQ